MQKIDCNSYNVIVNEDYSILHNFIDEYNPSKLFIIVDENTKRDCLPILIQKIDHPHILIEITSGEIHKSIDTATALWEALINYGADRSSLVLNLGGGVIGDMGGFVAASYMRGIPFIQIPTTLLSQVDASVGGKLGIDFKGYKNMVGLFQNPDLVWVDTNYLKTLSARELKSGFAEVIKHGLIQSKTLWSFIKDRALDYNDQEWNDIVFDSIKIKNTVVSQDPRESGLRKILNFGHTIGHAVESYYLETDKQLTHGEAIAIGMICESYLSHKKGLLSTSALKEIESFIRKIYNFDPAIQINQKRIIEYMTNDKKNKGGQILFSLIDGIGSCTYNIEIGKEAIIEGLDYF